MNTPEKRKKKILYLITKSNWGGAQRYVFDLASSLDPSQYDVAVALGGDGRLREELKKNNIRVIPLKNMERDISLLKEFRTAWELFTLLYREKPDILHINSSKAGGLGGFLGRLVGVPQIIFTAHGWAFNEDRPGWQKIIIHYLHWLTVFLSHKTIAVSETIKQQMTGPLISYKMEVIHNGRPPISFLSHTASREYFCKLIPALTPYKDDFWSATIGELHKIKRHDVVIHALKKVVTHSPSVRHIIIGEGDERENLAQLIKDLGLQNHVFLAGAVMEGAQYLKAFDLFVLGSKSEALGIVIIEAAMAGLPILASNVGGIPEIITHRKNGSLFPEGDRSKLTEYYVELLSNPPLRHNLGQAALTRSADFSFEKSFAQTISLYEAPHS